MKQAIFNTMLGSAAIAVMVVVGVPSCGNGWAQAEPAAPAFTRQALVEQAIAGHPGPHEACEIIEAAVADDRLDAQGMLDQIQTKLISGQTDDDKRRYLDKAKEYLIRGGVTEDDTLMDDVDAKKPTIGEE